MPLSSSTLSVADKRVVVFKVGGSLLDRSGLATCLRELAEQRSDSVPLLTVGGGGAADLSLLICRTITKMMKARIAKFNATVMKFP